MVLSFCGLQPYCEEMSLNKQILLQVFMIQYFCVLQSYYEELLRQSPRRRLLGEYARQLVRRYPALRDEIASRTSRVTALWNAVEAAVSLPATQHADTDTVITGERTELITL